MPHAYMIPSSVYAMLKFGPHLIIVTMSSLSLMAETGVGAYAFWVSGPSPNCP
jgi:hypothetical protein